MPTYEYECTQCDRVFEVFQSMSARPKRTLKTDCKQCQNKAPVVRRIGTGAAVIFKGSGFYETDYRSESYRADAKKESEAKKGDKKDKSDTKNGKTSESKSGSDGSASSKSASTESKSDQSKSAGSDA